jgi:hypothetical protein
VPLAVVSTRTQDKDFGFCGFWDVFVLNKDGILMELFFTIFLHHLHTTFG